MTEPTNTEDADRKFARALFGAAAEPDEPDEQPEPEPTEAQLTARLIFRRPQGEAS